MSGEPFLVLTRECWHCLPDYRPRKQLLDINAFYAHRYLNRVDDALKSTSEQTGGGPVTLLAHSAGGWLGRVYLLGFGTQDRVDKFVTLGSPHLPPLKVRVQPPAAHSTLWFDN